MEQFEAAWTSLLFQRRRRFEQELNSESATITASVR